MKRLLLYFFCMEQIVTLSGKPMPLGAHVYADGVNFSVFSRNGTRVILNLFGTSEDTVPYASLELDPEKNRTGDLWHIFVKDLKPGALYLYQVDGPFDIDQGHRFDVEQYLLDPYAKAITDVSVFLNTPSDHVSALDKGDLIRANFNHDFKFPKCVVIDDNNFDWQGDKPINRPLSESIIYETHLKGFTASDNSGVQHPGTYLGMVEKIDYLKRLGMTAVELLPIFEFDENENCNINPRTGDRMKNYWGYSTIDFFAPKASYAADRTPGGCVNEFKLLVRELHKAGIEVILDVVFNHTAEGNEHGLTLNFRGFDNTVYYSLVKTQPQYYLNFSGCGNTVNCNHPVVRDYIVDCLRYWVLEYHIDGFRFDLAPVLARSQEGDIIRFPPLTNRISEDPVLASTKIIAEPWDAGGGYLLGNFPGGRWAEWNDRYRDDIRKFWRGDDYASTGAATRVSGSSDIFGWSGRKPWHGINFVTCHDGFTLNDLVSYNGKHNEQNGEDNRDGTDNNVSYNYGYEGPTANPTIERRRIKQIKNFILTLLVSQGTPMLLAGDEFRRTQMGNNNAYCQDNELSYFDWSLVKDNDRLVTFVSRAINLRKAYPELRRREFFVGERSGSNPDIRWYNFDGTTPDWNKLTHFLAFKLGGSGNNFYIAANTDIHDITVTLPTPETGRKWFRIADTSIDADDAITPIGREEQLRTQGRYIIPASSLIILIAK